MDLDHILIEWSDLHYNTITDSTKEKIAEVLIKCAEQLPEDEKLPEPLQILNVTCLTRPNPNGEALRTKCWKVQVANKLREYMLKDEAYPYGWSHRRYFPKRTQHNVPLLDPVSKRQHLQAQVAAVNGEPEHQHQE